MKLVILQSTSTETLVIATDNPARLAHLEDWKFKQIDEFDENDARRIHWICDALLVRAKKGIEKNGFVTIRDGEIKSVLPELFGFFPEEEQEVIPDAYWATKMTKFGQLGTGCSGFMVRFRDEVPHTIHSHDHHSEMLLVVAGAIEQTIGSEKRRLDVGGSAIIPQGMEHWAKPLVPGTIVVVILLGGGTEYVVRDIT